MDEDLINDNLDRLDDDQVRDFAERAQAEVERLRTHLWSMAANHAPRHPNDTHVEVFMQSNYGTRCAVIRSATPTAEVRDVKALTLWQPWASLVALGVKTIETRSKPTTDHRGPVAIHAGSRWEKGWRGVWVDPWSERPADAEKVRRYDLMVETLGCYPIEDANGSYYWTTDCRHLPLGAVVATATLTDCIPTEKLTVGGATGEKGWTPPCGDQYPRCFRPCC